jgi:adenine C2-methylase RlmN of 23S rRNA A2503 and tRNA A37
MGMGEPLDNYNEVLGALRALLDPGRFGLAAAHVTVSTVGVVPRIRSLCKVIVQDCSGVLSCLTVLWLWVGLSQDAPGVSLALSLHAPNQELRCKIVPTARAWPLDVLMAAVDDFSAHW